MIKNFFKILTIPFVYILFIFLAIIKWFIIAPLLFILHILKHSLIWIIVGIVAGFFLTPIATLVIVLISIITSISNIFSEISMGIFGDLKINWDYAGKVFIENENNNLILKRKKLINKANKEYKKSIDEFYGFEKIAKIYRE